jgi:hypothetical protein
MSSGIRGMLGFQFWVNNDNRAPIEALLSNTARIPAERAAILKELQEEHKNTGKKGLNLLANPHLKP